MKRILWIAICAIGVSVTASGVQKDPVTAPLAAQEAQAILNKYCTTCHNQRSKTGNLELDTKDLAHLEKDVVAWESVVRKLRTGMMPPKNAARPDRATLDGLATWLESGLDRQAALHPNPGSPSVQRMNRNEYANAIRDLLDLEVDVSAMLPGDSIDRRLRQHRGRSGNIAIPHPGVLVRRNEDQPSGCGRSCGAARTGNLSAGEGDFPNHSPGRNADRHRGRHVRATQLSAGCGIRDPRRRHACRPDN